MQRILGFFILLLISPVYLMIMLLIYLEDGGPVHFKQKRPGVDNKLFDFYKFRSMRKDTPNVATHLLLNPQQYLLKVGKFIRKYSLDELPNLINIIRGEIGFVGPRPALYNQDDLISMRTERGIHKLKPGLTGWAQINGRDEISIEQKVELEYWYLQNKTLWLDIKIFFLTFWKAIFGSNVTH
jgi:O-antigen biosynthesis protein WbqP